MNCGTAGAVSRNGAASPGRTAAAASLLLIIRKLLGVLIGIAGLGYIYDSIGTFVSGGSWTQVSTVTFIGEFLLALWLVIWGRRITVSQPVLRAEPAGVAR